MSTVVSGDSKAVVSSILEFMFYETNRVLADFQKKTSRLVTKLVLIGSGSTMIGLREIATKNFEMEISYGKPFNKVEAPAFLADILTEVGPGFAVATGLALRELQDVG